MVEGSLLELLKAQGIEVDNLMTRVYGKYEETMREFDIVAVNGEELVAVEVKTTLKKKDVDYFLETMQNFKKFFPIYTNRKIYGAVAYIRGTESSEVYAEKKGLFVIRAVGKNAMLMNAKNFKPKELTLSKK